jgi:prolyl-tRNA synthetase
MSVVRASSFFMPTLKQAPVDAVAVSHQLLFGRASSAS